MFGVTTTEYTALQKLLPMGNIARILPNHDTNWFKERTVIIKSLDRFVRLPKLFSQDVNLQGLWNVFQSYWGSPEDHPQAANLEQPPPHDAPHHQFDHRPGSSSDSLGSHDHVDPGAPSAGSGDHVASPANVAEGDTPPSGESESPFSMYDVVDLDDIDGVSIDGEEEAGIDMGTPVSGGMPNGQPIPGPSLAPASSHTPSAVGNLDPASIAQRKQELAAKIAELRWACW